ncbi:MAG: hypothetical protein ACI4WQ_05070 [Sharpea porci]
MSKKKKLTLLLVAVLIVAVTGFTFAAQYTSADHTKKVSLNTLGISLVQTADASLADAKDEESTPSDRAKVSYTNIIPGKTINEKIAVKTDADSQPAYIRVTATRYWIDKEGKKVEKAEGEDGYLDPEAIEIETKDQENWKVMKDEDDPEVIYFYYLLPVNSDSETSHLMDSFKINEKYADNDYADMSTRIDFFAEGVQQSAGKDAILASWGIDVTLDDSGKLKLKDDRERKG